MGSSEYDGRLARSERTKKQIVEAYMLLLREMKQIPTTAQIAARAGYSVRTVFAHFSDVAKLSIAACDHAIQQGLSTPLGNIAAADRQTRLRFAVEVRARNCETWLPLWRMLIHYQGSVPELDRRVRIARVLSRERFQLVFRAELSTMSETDLAATLIGLESLTDFESWGRMRESYNLTYEEACRSWTIVIDRLLPPTPEGPALASEVQ